MARPAAPHPALDPEEVVRLLLAGLRSAGPDRAEYGAALLHAFATARMRAAVGGVDDLARALRNDRFAPLLAHDRAAPEALERLGNAARQVVSVTAGAGGPAAYLFSLSRRSEGPSAGCWLVTGVARADLPE